MASNADMEQSVLFLIQEQEHVFLIIYFQWLVENARTVPRKPFIVLKMNDGKKESIVISITMSQKIFGRRKPRLKEAFG